MEAGSTEWFSIPGRLQRQPRTLRAPATEPNRLGHLLFFNSSHANGLRWHLLVLICISLMTDEVECFLVQIEYLYLLWTNAIRVSCPCLRVLVVELQDPQVPWTVPWTDTRPAHIPPARLASSLRYRRRPLAQGVLSWEVPAVLSVAVSCAFGIPSSAAKRQVLSGSFWFPSARPGGWSPTGALWCEVGVPVIALRVDVQLPAPLAADGLPPAALGTTNDGIRYGTLIFRHTKRTDGRTSSTPMR